MMQRFFSDSMRILISLTVLGVVVQVFLLVPNLGPMLGGQLRVEVESEDGPVRASTPTDQPHPSITREGSRSTEHRTGSSSTSTTFADRGPGPSFISEETYLGGPPQVTLQAVQARVTKFYAAQGIDDKELVMMVTLDEGDRSHHQVLIDVEQLRRSGQARRAIERIQSALAELPGQHHIARARLLDSLSLAALDAGDLALAAKVSADLRAVREKVSDILARVSGGKAGIDPAARQKMAELARQVETAERALYDMASKLGGDGDLSKIPGELRRLAQVASVRR